MKIQILARGRVLYWKLKSLKTVTMAFLRKFLSLMTPLIGAGIGLTRFKAMLHQLPQAPSSGIEALPCLSPGFSMCNMRIMKSTRWNCSKTKWDDEN